MRDLAAILPVTNESDILVDDQELEDIEQALMDTHRRHKSDYDKIANDFWTGDAVGTAKCLFDYCQKNIAYKIEPDTNQTVKSPGRILADGKGDCKHYASFINGVVDSLQRQGRPIRSKYVFISDAPDKPIHHVFASVYPKGISGKGEIWVDPVLAGFNRKPKYFKVKYMIPKNGGIGKLTYLSGTDAPYFGDVAEIGKRKHRNIFREWGRGLERTIKQTERQAERNFNTVKNLTLKIGMAPARNSFMALLDINLFNLAVRMHEALKTPKAAQMLRQWHDIGGDPNKLKNAIRNGVKHHNYYHKGHKVSGESDTISIGRRRHHSAYITEDPREWMELVQQGHHPHPMIDDRMVHPWHHRHGHHRRHTHGRGSHHADWTPYVAPGTHSRGSRHADIHGSLIGMEPISTGSLMAMASALIAAFSKFLHLKAEEKAALSKGIQQGTALLADKAGSGLDAANQEGGATAQDASKLDAMTAPGTDRATMAIKTGTDAQGNPQLTISDAKHPALDNAGAPDGGAAADVTPPTAAAAPDSGAQPGADQAPAPAPTGVMSMFTGANAKKMIVPAVIVGGALLILPQIMGKKRR